LELIANPTESWRIFLNLSQGEVKQTSIGQEARDYLAKYRDFWTQPGKASLIVAGTGLTVGQTVTAVEQEIQNLYIVPNGQQGRGQVPRQLNLVTNYQFGTGRLKGFSMGGGARYRSGEVVNFEITRDPATGSVTNKVIHGRDNSLLDFNLGYRGRFNLRQRAIRWSVQLRINNLLDVDQMLPTREISGTVVTYRLQPPREWILSSKFDF
jgi:hypothetical protein